VEGSCEHGNEPVGSIRFGKFLSSCTTGGFSRRAQLHVVSYGSSSQVITLCLNVIYAVGHKHVSCILC
jgi:hypothetical protein